MTPSLNTFWHRACGRTRALTRRVAMPLTLGAALVLTGCDTGRDPATPSGDVTTLVVSETWMRSAPDDVDVQARLASLQRAIKQLRAETGTGWIGRQDDVTGYLAELSGGGRAGGPTELFDSYGPALFGIDSGALDLGEPDGKTVPGSTTTRAAQVLGGVPVLDGELVFSGRSGAEGTDDDRLTRVRGRVFPGLSVSTEPQLSAEAAARAAEDAAQGQAQGRPRVVVLPTGTGVLTWEVTVVGGSGADSDAETTVALYYIDARTGDVVTVRPTSLHLAPALHGPGAPAEPDPNTVEVTGADPLGRSLTGQGLRVPEGVELTDTTTPFWDSASREGGVLTYDATGLGEGQLPGKLVLSPTAEIAGPEAIAAHVYGRTVLDYYAELGRDSWDGEGGSLVSSVNFGEEDFCNAFFSSALSPPQMVYGNPCVRQGVQQSGSLVEPDVVAHEITHGVTATSANLLYTGQSGALNESFSDYFGNVIGDRLRGVDSAAFGEDLCVGVPDGSSMCRTNPDGSRSMRYMLNGNGFDEYLRVLDPGQRLKLLELSIQDNGGVHINSAIWNNALWSIRTQLAQIDGEPGVTSAMARDFDRAVYAALTTQLVATSGFVDAAAAVEQSIVALELDPTVLRVAREVFQATQLCPGCNQIDQLAGTTVSANPQTQLHPTVSGDRVAWLDLSGPYEGAGFAATAQVDGSAPTLGSAPDALEVAFAGEALLALTETGSVLRIDPEGGTQQVARTSTYAALTRGFVGSDAGAAWAVGGDKVAFVGPDGLPQTVSVPDLQGDQIYGLGTGGGTVAIGTEDGKVYLWRPGSTPTRLGTVNGFVVNLATYGDNVMAIHCERSDPQSLPTCAATLFTAEGRRFRVSDNPTVHGAAMSADYVVWPEGRGPITSGVVEAKPVKWQDTDLRLLSLRTGNIYDVLPGVGQQGFPALSGNRLVWQDAAFGGDDILTGVLRSGL